MRAIAEKFSRAWTGTVFPEKDFNACFSDRWAQLLQRPEQASAKHFHCPSLCLWSHPHATLTFARVDDWSLHQCFLPIPLQLLSPGAANNGGHFYQFPPQGLPWMKFIQTLEHAGQPYLVCNGVKTFLSERSPMISVGILKNPGVKEKWCMTLVKDGTEDSSRRTTAMGFCNGTRIRLNSKCSKDKWGFPVKKLGGEQWMENY